MLLLFRKKDGGRVGKIWSRWSLSSIWVLATPIAALALVDLLSPDLPPVHVAGRRARSDGHRAARRGYGSAPLARRLVRRADSRRFAACPRGGAGLSLLGGVPIIATGGRGSSPYSEAGLMAAQLEQLGVPADDIIREEKSTNTRDHALLRAAAVEAARHRAVRARHVAAAYRARAGGLSRRGREPGAVDSRGIFSGARWFSRCICRRAGPVRERAVDLRPSGVGVLQSARLGVIRIG